MSLLPAPAVDALRAHELTSELADILGRMPSDDVARFGSRALIAPLLDAAGVAAFRAGPEGRVWQFEGDLNDIVEPLTSHPGGWMRVRTCTDALVRLFRAVDPDDEDAAYEAQVAVADVLTALRSALPDVHEHLILASLGLLMKEAGLRSGKVRIAEGGGLVLEFAVRPKAEDDLERAWNTVPAGAPEPRA